MNLFILILFVAGTPVTVPMPYHSAETCKRAGDFAIASRFQTTDYVCLPVDPQ